MNAVSPPTRWSLVLAAGGVGKDASAALQALLVAYRPVMLSYYRRHAGVDAADDATQGFLLHFVEHGLAGRADRERGSFRAFLYRAMENHRRQSWRDAHAARRDEGIAVDPHALDAVVDPTPEPSAAFDRDWALRVIDRALSRLRDEAIAAGREKLFDALRPYLVEAPDPGDYASLASVLGLTPNALAAAVKRLRERLRTLARRELADTLPAGADVDAELGWLRRALRAD